MKENFYSSRDRNISILDKQTSSFLNPLLTKCEVTSKYAHCFLPRFDQSVFQQPWQAHRWLLNLLTFTSFTFPFLFSPARSDHVYRYNTARTIQILHSAFTALAVNVARMHRKHRHGLLQKIYYIQAHLNTVLDTLVSVFLAYWSTQPCSRRHS